MNATKNYSYKHICLTIVIFCIISIQGFSQTNYLGKRISIFVANVPLPEALEEISHTADVNFSYNASHIDATKKVSINAENVPVSKILDNITDKQLRYKVIGQHIILLPKKTAEPDKKELSFFTLSGTITDARTNQLIRNVSVYSVKDRNSVISDQNGTYSMKLPAGDEAFAINYSKRNYFDTIIFCRSLEDMQISIALEPEFSSTDQVNPLKVQLESHPISELKLVNTFVPEEALINAENLKVYEKRPAQISFLPYLGSNAKVSGTMSNNVSVNVIAGFTGAVDGVEIGSILNITKRHVNGVQVSGFGNITGDYSRGTQVAGFFNRTTGTVQGVQVAGFTNLTRNKVSGVQLSGFLNKSKGTVSGVQAAGFSNFVQDKVTGVQIAGFNNILNGKMDGVQLSGFNNFTTQNVDGAQVTGFLNIALKDVKVMQLAGFMNYSRGTNKGVQVAGFLNVADTMKGFQLAVINVSDTSSGVSLGLFNHVKNGFRAIEVSANEVLPVNLTYKTGTYKLYNIFTTGISLSGTNPWGAGAGLGTMFRNEKKFSMALELIASQINETEVWDPELNLLNKLGFTFNYNFAKHFSIKAGPTLNVHVSSLKDPDTGEFISNIAVNPFYEGGSDVTRVQMWLGGSVGVSF